MKHEYSDEELDAMGIKVLEDLPDLPDGMFDDNKRLQIGEDTTAANLAKSNTGKNRKQNASKKNSFVKDFPTAFIRIAQATFPNATNQTDAVVAYMYCTCPEIAMSNEAMFAITDAQKELIQNYGENVFTDFNSRLKQIMRKLDKLSDENSFLEMMLLHFIYDWKALGNPEYRYRMDNGKNFDITDKGRFLDFMEDMKIAWGKYKEQVNYLNGKPW